MNYITLKKKIFSGMPLDEYTRIGGDYYKLIDNCVLICFGIRRMRCAFDIQYSVYPLTKGSSIMGVFDLKRGFIGQSAYLRYCQDKGLDATNSLTKLMPAFAKSDSEMDQLIRFARDVISYMLDILNGYDSVRDCCSLLMKLYPVDENFRMVIPQEAETVCQALLLAKERETSGMYAREFRTKWEAGVRAQGHNCLINEWFIKYIDCPKTGDYSPIYDDMLEGYTRMVNVLNNTKLRLTDKAVNDFKESIAWMIKK